MEEIDFIKNVLFKWVKQFENIHIKYAYEQNSEFHIIEVEPEELRLHDSNYKKAERSLWKDFMKRFPESDLLISEPCKTNDMSNILYEYISPNTLKDDLTIGNNIHTGNYKISLIWESNNDFNWEQTIKSEIFDVNKFNERCNFSSTTCQNHQFTLAA